MKKFILPRGDDRKSVLNALTLFAGSLNEGKAYAVEIKEHRKTRSLDQNAISHAWYLQIAADRGEDNPLGVKRYCKLVCGVPIMRAEDEGFRATYDRVIKPLDYDDKLAVMDIMPVTSLMNTAQMSQYLEAVQEHYRKQGVLLEFPQQEAA